MSEKININIFEDRLQLKDKVPGMQRTSYGDLNFGPKGFVQINEIDKDGNKKLIVNDNNLIVYRGRSMAISRMFGKDICWQSETQALPFLGMSDKYIAFFAVGTGGASSSNNQNPLTVNSAEWQLRTHGDVSGSGDYVTINGRTYKPFDPTSPTFLTESEIINNSDILSSLQNVNFESNKRDTYLVAKVDVTLDSGDANGTGSQEINEAGLFLAESDDINYDFSSYTSNNQHLELFAKINFPTITKNSSRSFQISWYIFF